MLKVIDLIKWFSSRIAMVYVMLFVLFFVFVGFDEFNSRIKIRLLNDARRDFAPMIDFAKHSDQKDLVDWEAFRNYFTLILKFIPDDAQAKNLLGYVYFYMGNQDKAISSFRESYDYSRGGLFWASYNLGVTYYKKKMYAQAVDYLGRAVVLDPKDTLAVIDSSIIYHQIFSSSNFKFNLNKEISEAKSAAYVLLVSSLYELGEYDKALAVTAVVVGNPNLSYKDQAYFYTGLVYEKLGQYDKALLLMNKSLDYEKNNPWVYFHMAQIYKEMGNAAPAEKLLKAYEVLKQKNDRRFPTNENIELRFF